MHLSSNMNQPTRTKFKSTGKNQKLFICDKSYINNVGTQYVRD